MPAPRKKSPKASGLWYNEKRWKDGPSLRRHGGISGATMESKGVLYTVQGPRGTYFVVYDPAAGRIWTERTEHAARQQASEVGLVLTSEESVTHEEMLRRTGRAADVAPAPPRPVAQTAALKPVAQPSPRSAPSRALESRIVPPISPAPSPAGRGGGGGSLPLPNPNDILIVRRDPHGSQFSATGPAVAPLVPSPDQVLHLQVAGDLSQLPVMGAAAPPPSTTIHIGRQANTPGYVPAPAPDDVT